MVRDSAVAYGPSMCHAGLHDLHLQDTFDDKGPRNFQLLYS